MNTLKPIGVLCLLLVAGAGYAQDSLRTLSVKQMMAMIMQNHPVARQANINIEKAKADVLASRGMFDPVLKNETAQKTFDGITYYFYNRPELNIPTWFGIEVSAGLEYLSGNRTDPVETKGQSSYIGISIPVAKNLLMDKRRAALQTAKIYRAASDIERRLILNNLLLDATKSYWDWVQHYQLYNILNEVVRVNQNRLQMVKTAHALGDRPAIDTTETLAQLQQYELLQSQALLNFQQAGLDLSVYLWTNTVQPFELPVDIIPADKLNMDAITSAPMPDLIALIDIAVKNHPELLLYNYKQSVLQVEKKLKAQELLPQINLRYNQLGSGYNIVKTATSPVFEYNYQYGIFFSVPLRLSQGRGEYRKTKFKITEIQLQQDQKKLQVVNKVKSYFNELMAIQNQVALQNKAYINYLALQRGEETRYLAGESSLFFINARENKALEARQKLEELKAKYYKTEAALQWAAGLLTP
jgi:outer membrane protein TolC